jgi:hypothetical protein
MIFSSIAAHDENTITVFNIDPVIGHCAASERLCQSRNSGAMSDTSLMFDVSDAYRPYQCLVYPAFFIVHGGTAD